MYLFIFCQKHEDRKKVANQINNRNITSFAAVFTLCSSFLTPWQALLVSGHRMKHSGVDGGGMTVHGMTILPSLPCKGAQCTCQLAWLRTSICQSDIIASQWWDDAGQSSRMLSHKSLRARKDIKNSSLSGYSGQDVKRNRLGRCKVCKL